MGGRGGQGIVRVNSEVAPTTAPAISTKKSIIAQNNAIADQLIAALYANGFTGIQKATSVTDFGTSTYVLFEDEFGIERKFRISDHSVGNFGRVVNEYHYSENFGGVNSLVSRVKSDIAAQAGVVAARRARSSLRSIRESTLNAKWDGIKSRFTGLVFKKADRTYQDFATFASKGPRSNIKQFPLGVKNGRMAYRYEWTEPASSAFGSDMPSLDYIEKL